MPRAGEGRGVAKPGKVTLSDVAKAAGVSSGTVSNTINRPESVADATRRRVQAAIRQLGFVPNEGAARLRSGSSRLLGLVVPDIASSFYAEIAKGVARRAEEHGHAMLLFDTGDDLDREVRQLETLARHRSIGALIAPRMADERHLRRLRALDMHLVLIDRPASEHDGCSVSIDDVQGGRMAARHLVALGRRRLAFVAGPVGVPQAERRLQGFRDAVADEVSVEPAVVHADSSDFLGGGEAARALLAMDPRPDGVFCVNDQLAVGVVNELTRAGLRVPQDVAVVGYGDTSVARSASVPLTTVRQPMSDLGRAAVDHLISESEGMAESRMHHHSSTVFQPSLVVRESAPSAFLSD